MGASAPAISYPDLCGEVRPGDPVLLNATALELGLGTGGVHLVIAVEGRDSPAEEPPGHVMKARYTPLQTAVASVEETHPNLLEASDGLAQTPVVCAPLHSMLAPVAAGAKRAADARVVYVMTDGAALAGGFSRLVEQMRAGGLLDGWITCGQAFGGELEAVTVWTGLLAAKELLDAEVIVVADGPGNLGTDTTWGVSALASGHALMAAATLRGPAHPRAPGELRGRTGAAPRRLPSLAHDPGRRLQGRRERPGSCAGGRRATERGLGGPPIASSSRRSTISSRWTERLRCRSSGHVASMCGRWDAGSRTIPRSSWRPGRPAFSPAGWPPRTAAGVSPTEAVGSPRSFGPVRMASGGVT